MATISGFVDVSPLDTSSGEVARENLSNTFPPSTTDGIFNNIQVGVGSYVFHVSEDGLWLGAEKFEDAPFSVAMDGTTTMGGGGSIEGALYKGQAANDVNTHATTISGRKITTGTITADQLAVGSVVASKIATGAIISEKILAGEIKAVNIAAGVISSTHIAASAITGVQLANGSVSDVKIANATITGGKIASATITGANISSATISNSNIVNSTITGAKIASATIESGHIVSLSADKITAGTIAAVTITSATITSGIITIPYSSAGGGYATTGYLKFGTSNNKIWVDTSQYMGIRANGGYIYFYGGTSQVAVISNAGQARFDYGVRSVGNFNGEANGSMFGYFNIGGTSTITGRLTLSAYAYFNGGAYLVGTSQFNCHINTITNNNYNLGGSTTYWRYVNCYRVSEHSLTSFDSPVEMRDGKMLDDIGALKAIKEDTIIDDVTGRPFLDKRSFPKDVLIPAYDQETGKPYERDENDRPLVPNEKGELEPRPDADGVSTGQMLSLLFGGFKQLVKRVEELEKKLK